MIKILLSYFLFISQTFAGFPPTTLKGQSQTAKPTVFNFQAPYSQATNTGASTSLIETDYQNRLANPSFENLVSTTSWTFGTGVSPALETTNVQDGLQSLALTLSSANGNVMSQDVTPTTQSQGQNYEYGMWVKTSASNLQVCARNAGAVIGNCNPVYSDSLWHYYPNNYPGVASGSIGTSLITTTSTSGTVYVDHAYTGPARNLSQVAQAYFFGGMEQAGNASGTCIYSENTSSGLNNFVDLGTGTGCASWTTSGSVSAVGTNDHRITLNNPGSGNYQIIVSGAITSGASQSCVFRLSDGTNTYQPQANGVGILVPSNSYSINYASSQSSVTLKLQAADNGSNACYLDSSFAGGGISWKVYYFPSSSQLAINPNIPSRPTVQRFTTGSGTYIPSAGSTYSLVRACAAGAGGYGSVAGGTAPTAGGNTTLGSFMTLTGGAIGAAPGGTNVGGAGGTVTLTTSANVIVQHQSTGGAGSGNSGAVNTAGGAGGQSLLGSFGAAGGSNAAGSQGRTGGGGGGGGGTAVAAGATGGGAGACAEFILVNTGSQSYAVGTAGTAGGAGAGGNVGGAGGGGYLEFTEYYGAMNAPVLVGGVIYSTTVQSGGSSGVTGINYGTYTPTLTNTSNVSASTPQVSNYYVIGNQVHVGGTLNVTCTTAGGTSTTLGISIPMASNFSSIYDLSGLATSSSATETGAIFADTTNKRATLGFLCQTTGDQALRFSIDYLARP